ncbi:MAG TPA: DUF5916 domain-containing protein [Bacteroidales bacterium]|nr:DUF5916 domain-containing protein [Bacteroidales bacterium]HPP92708.1 DUF5916 domain-containing protein [Bacteroidales bacterium]HRR17357.1 DUF5916 domain-containing protein [Bacteroidales bacterium]
MNLYKPVIALFYFLLCNLMLSAQNKAVNRDKYRIHITYTEEKITIDGLLDENIWQIVEKAVNFQRVTPTDTGYAIAQTVAMIAYDKNNIYVGAICYDPTPGKRPVQSLRRDFTFMGNDSFAVFFDPFNDQTNGFGFYVSPAGAQYDHLGYERNRFNIYWDAKWRSAVKNYDDRWVVEMAIPFRSLRYIKGYNEWGVNFGRLDLKTNEKSAWAPMPRQFSHCDLTYTGTLIWDKPLEKSGFNYSVIPYVTGKIIKENIPEENTVKDWGAGFDAKVMLSTSLNLDVTVNPDYSQVEEDRQVTNLQRFELFFPERRQYFLENSDLFANLGNSNARPFFSRRIGLNVPVNAGLRLSGKIGDRWRVGLMDIQTGEKDIIPASNFAVVALQRQVFSRSSITGFFINKEVTGSYNDSLYRGYDYNRVAGLEYNLASPDNIWSGKAFYHQSFYPGASGDDAAAAGELNYSSRYLKAGLVTAWVGDDYVAEVGYIRRKGYFEVSPSLRYTFYPSQTRILSHGPSVKFDMITDPAFGVTDRETNFGYSIGFRDRSQLDFEIAEEYILLDRDYDPTNTGGETLKAGEAYNWVSGEAGFSSDSRRLFTYSLSTGYGTYFNGRRFSVNGSVGYRFQPYGSISVSADYNNITLPQPYSSAELILISPRLDITFTDKIFLTTFVQYNNQIDNINTNIRFQWRFAPVSDLFIVYTNNSFTNDFKSKNNGIVIKLTYWFN